jgi:HK97 family phage prohead protease
MSSANTTTGPTVETRIATLYAVDAGLSLRAEGDGGVRRFIGVIPFNSLSVDLGGWRERITPSAFNGTLANKQDVRALVDHDSAKLLGRTSNNTVQLTATPTGLAVSIDMPATTYAADAAALVTRGDVKGLSFGFHVRGDAGQRFVNENGVAIRELLDVDLREVSIVSSPAYQDTSVAVRSATFDPAVLALIRPEFPRRRTAMAKLALSMA